MDTSCLIGKSPFRLMAVSFPGLSQELATAFEAFDRVLEYYSQLPWSERSQYSILEPWEQKPDLGFRERSAEEGKDNKIVFQYSHELGPLLPSHLQAPEITRFLAVASGLYDAVRKQVLAAVRELDEALDGRFGLYQRTRNYRHHKLRLLKYRDTEGELAGMHYDKSFLSAHLGETSPGFLVKVSGAYHPVVTRTDTMQVFPGLKAPKATAGIISPLYHGAIVTNRIPLARKSAAFFLHGPWELLTRDTHTELSGM